MTNVTAGIFLWIGAIDFPKAALARWGWLWVRTVVLRLQEGAQLIKPVLFWLRSLVGKLLLDISPLIVLGLSAGGCASDRAL